MTAVQRGQTRRQGVVVGRIGRPPQIRGGLECGPESGRRGVILGVHRGTSRQPEQGAVPEVQAALPGNREAPLDRRYASRRFAQVQRNDRIHQALHHRRQRRGRGLGQRSHAEGFEQASGIGKLPAPKTVDAHMQPYQGAQGGLLGIVLKRDDSLCPVLDLVALGLAEGQGDKHAERNPGLGHRRCPVVKRTQPPVELGQPAVHLCEVVILVKDRIDRTRPREQQSVGRAVCAPESFVRAGEALQARCRVMQQQACAQPVIEPRIGAALKGRKLAQPRLQRHVPSLFDQAHCLRQDQVAQIGPGFEFDQQHGGILRPVFSCQQRRRLLLQLRQRRRTKRRCRLAQQEISEQRVVLVVARDVSMTDGEVAAVGQAFELA